MTSGAEYVSFSVSQTKAGFISSVVELTQFRKHRPE